MKATDLMLGDWVTGKKWRENPFKLTRINDNEKYFYGITADGSRVGPFFLEELEPIPLTPEILEKNGFESIITVFNGLTYQYVSKEECRVRVFVNDKNIATCIEIDSKDCWLNYDCSFVHELQHALKVCRIKKEIEL